MLTSCRGVPIFAECFTFEAAIFFSMIFERMSIKTKTKQLVFVETKLKPQTVTVMIFAWTGSTMS